MAFPFLTEYFRRETSKVNQNFPSRTLDKNEIVLGLKIEFMLTKPSSKLSKETRESIQMTLQAWANSRDVMPAAKFAYDEYRHTTPSPDKDWLIYSKAYDIYRKELLLFLAKNIRSIANARLLDDLKAAKEILTLLSHVGEQDNDMGGLIRVHSLNDVSVYIDQVDDKVDALENPPSEILPSAEIIQLFPRKISGPGQPQ